MDDEVLDDEVVESADVPETTAQGEFDLVETGASEGVDGVECVTERCGSEPDLGMDRQIEERANKIAEEKIEARLIRDRVKREREVNERFSKYQRLESILKAGLGVNDLDEAISKTSEFYKEQGVNIPSVDEKYSSLNERDMIVLAKADAQDIMECGEKEMEYEANRIADIPRDKRTLRERVMFDELCRELVSIRNVRELKDKGYDVKVLESDEFKEFSRDINKPIVDVYEMFSRLNGFVKQAPKSPGSAKTSVANESVKEFYTPEEARKFSEEDLIRNPKLEEAIERSMLRWGK